MQRASGAGLQQALAHRARSYCRFQKTFEEIYNATSLDIPFYAIAGK